jgi:hypothetical protein
LHFSPFLGFHLILYKKYGNRKKIDLVEIIGRVACVGSLLEINKLLAMLGIDVKWDRTIAIIESQPS